MENETFEKHGRENEECGVWKIESLEKNRLDLKSHYLAIIFTILYHFGNKLICYTT